MKKQILFLAGVALMASSCSTVSYTSKTADVSTKIQTLTVADVKVQPERKTATAEYKWTPFAQMRAGAMKEEAAYKILQESNSDLLIEPQVVVNSRGIFRGGTVTVSGYPAKYSNFRPMTKEDAEIIATYEGRISPIVVCTAETPVSIGKQAPSMKSKLKNTFKSKAPKTQNIFNESKNYHNMITILGGPMTYDDVYHSYYGYSYNDGTETGFHVGAMYTHVWDKWGMYGKLNITSTGEGEGTTAIVTIGGVKTLSSKWNLFAGMGIGGVSCDHYGSYYYGDHTKRNTAFAWDCGFQWTKKRFGLSFGITASHGAGHSNWAPFAGVGFRF